MWRLSTRSVRQTPSRSSERQPEYVADLIADARELAWEWSRRKYGAAVDAMTLDCRCDPLLTVPVCRHPVVMALANLLDNAIDAYAPEQQLLPGEIRVEAFQDEQELILTIADRGLGMLPDDVEAYSQFRPGRYNQSKPFSHGYGLPIAARNLSLHEGRLTLASQFGAGTTVTVRLPRHLGAD